MEDHNRLRCAPSRQTPGHGRRAGQASRWGRMAAFNMTAGRYLKLYPRGDHSEAALDRLAELLESAIKENSGYQIGDKAELKKTLAEARSIVGKTSGPKTDAVLKQLDRVALRYR